MNQVNNFPNKDYEEGFNYVSNILGEPLTLELRKKIKDKRFFKALIFPNYLLCPLIKRGCKRNIEYSPSCCHLAPSRKTLPRLIGRLLE